MLELFYRLSLLAIVSCQLFPAWAVADERPSLILTRYGVDAIRSELGQVPPFDAAVHLTKAEVDAEIQLGVETPVPRDLSGGYTHERHKRNFLILPKAGALFHILEDERYAEYVRDMLFQYAAMYPSLPLHPETRSYARGKLFWQCLNDANWLLYAAQAYDAIYEWLSPDERERLETNLFRPFADFLSLDNPQFFNRVHNHSAWGNAAVGMIGLAMRDEELVKRALYGLDDDSVGFDERDNDGGFIRRRGQAAGFLANLDEPFSPDGYYTEGPYYQRYAMYPFLIFGLALHNVKPELGILDYKDGVLLKAVDALLNLSDEDGEFFPLNDAQKGMSVVTPSMVTAVNIAYHIGGNDPKLLDVAKDQGTVALDDAGFAVATGIRDGKGQTFEKRTVNLRDGPNGEQGGVSVLRDDDVGLTLVFKYTAQGLSHGHYDKLSFSMYEKGTEVLQDYGMVRFVNIEQKGGGNYLPQNGTWAKQTIAHNTVTQNERSHFGGHFEIGSQHHSELVFFQADDPGLQAVSAKDEHAYPGSVLRRTLAMLKDSAISKPIVFDLFQIDSQPGNRYDLPYWYQGQFLDITARLQAPDKVQSFGVANGYQYLYTEAVGPADAAGVQFHWLRSGRLYSLTAATQPRDGLYLLRLGANDPALNLRRDPAFMLRRDDAGAHTTFATVIESHGHYSPVTELTSNPRGQVTSVRVVYDDNDYTAVKIELISGAQRLFAVANADTTANAAHKLSLNGASVAWHGPVVYTPID